MDQKFSKILSGGPFLDDELLGIYLNKATLFYGPDDGGRRVALVQFLRCCFQVREATVLVTEEKVDDLLLLARSIGFDMEEMLSCGALTVLNFDVGEIDGDGCLPLPESLDDFIEEADRRHASRVVIDTILPWLQKIPVAEMPAQVGRFFDRLDGTHFTSLLFMREPVSQAAHDLVREVSKRCAIVVRYKRAPAGNDAYSIRVEEYKGLTTHVLPLEAPICFYPGRGFGHPHKGQLEAAVERRRVMSSSASRHTAMGPEPSLRVSGGAGLVDMSADAVSGVAPVPTSREPSQRQGGAEGKTVRPATAADGFGGAGHAVLPKAVTSVRPVSFADAEDAHAKGEVKPRRTVTSGEEAPPRKKGFSFADVIN